ncbi:MAG: NADH dehydrogenase [Clostridia bacterium]|nr:NADH dehydrogenase [Clostridia bacterium]
MRGNTILPLMAFLPMLGAIVCYLIGRVSKPARNMAVFAVCAVDLAMAAGLFAAVLAGRSAEFYWDGFCGLGLHLKLDGFRAVYALIAGLMWFMTSGLFAPVYFETHYRNRNRYYLFTLLTLGATNGVFLSASLYTTFIFFEIMSLTSYAWVAHDEKDAAMRAAQTYLAVAIIGGMVTLMGLFMLYHRIGTLEIDEIYALCAQAADKRPLRLIGALIAVGFAAKAGAFPLHIWLPKAHPVAPAPASALLSGILTKTGVFGVLAVSADILPRDAAWGNAVLVFGVITMFVGALLALFSIDLKRTLACSSMSQIGFILVGVGMANLLGHHDGLAAHGALLHMVNHSLIKLVLFMAAGAVYMRLHKLDLNDIRGFGRGKPALHFAFLMGYLGIIGMPLWNGFVSKSLIHESILEYVELLRESGGAWVPYKTIEILFLFTGGMTAAYMTKLYVAIFWEKNDAETQKRYDGMGRFPLPAALALGLSALILPVLGIFSNRLMQGIAALMQGFMRSDGPHEALNYFSRANLVGAVESLLIGAALYAFVVRGWLMKRQEDGRKAYVNRWPARLDLEELLYRPLLERMLPAVLGSVCYALDHLADWATALLGRVGTLAARAMDSLFNAKALNAVGTFFARIMDEGVDTLALGLWHMLFSRPRRREAATVGNRFTYTMGRLFDQAALLLNRTVRRKRPIKTSFVAVFAAGWEDLRANMRRISWSVSFGLLLMCVGLYIVFAYLLM